MLINTLATLFVSAASRYVQPAPADVRIGIGIGDSRLVFQNAQLRTDTFSGLNIPFYCIMALQASCVSAAHDERFHLTPCRSTCEMYISYLPSNHMSVDLENVHLLTVLQTRAGVPIKFTS